MDLDLVSLLPSMESLLDKTDLLLRIFVMAGPLALLGLGLYYFLLPPKEANHTAGYRFRYGMSKVGVWRFMQTVAGIIYSGVGLLLTQGGGSRQLGKTQGNLAQGRLVGSGGNTHLGQFQRHLCRFSGQFFNTA